MVMATISGIPRNEIIFLELDERGISFAYHVDKEKKDNMIGEQIDEMPFIDLANELAFPYVLEEQRGLAVKPMIIANVYEATVVTGQDGREKLRWNLPPGEKYSTIPLQIWSKPKTGDGILDLIIPDHGHALVLTPFPKRLLENLHSKGAASAPRQ